MKAQSWLIASAKQGFLSGGSKGGGDHKVEACLWKMIVSSFLMGWRVNSPKGRIVYRTQ